MPAEWSPHDACLILYPHLATTFRLDRARREVEQIARTIAFDGKEKVILYCNTDTDRHELKERLQSDGFCNEHQIQLELCPSNDTWVRDTGPTFVWSGGATSEVSTRGPSGEEEKTLIGLDWEFNAYGGPEDGPYWPCDLDCQIASVICRQLSLPCQSVPLVLEGGSFHTDGEGTILTTEECLLSPNRNPTLSKTRIEEIICSELGASKMIWLPHGLAFDADTTGHVDNWACFIRPGHVVLAWTDDEQGDALNFERCRQSLQILEQSFDAQGRQLTIHKLYLPSPLYYTQDDVDGLLLMDERGDDGIINKAQARQVGERMAGSYVNFYIANNAVVVPQFGDPVHDVKAIQTLTPLFAPERSVVGVPSREVLIGGGNIHCITQQLPSKKRTVGNWIEVK